MILDLISAASSTPAPDPVLIQMVGGKSSWWDSSGASAVIGVAGAILGALIALIGSLGVAIYNRRKTALTRWDADIRALSVSLISACESLRKARTDQLHSAEISPKLLASEEDCKALIKEIQETSETLQLISPPGIAEDVDLLAIAMSNCEVLENTATHYPLDQVRTLRATLRKHFVLKKK
ncbi:hypothetical protein GCM10010922_02860 [Microbacterium sorbitolivorans]|uniref:hypothetical protein n=1 Tax=Microbacterium sorbitolivorans TaxID=1867410 RepID=UPI0013B06DB2|nr:hypothetical protein [Microbacterium sorbitolivorans]GGF31239.1 hypothetical protein GCM10010922_02860 [Microbacterium sorbitolivorans]